MSNCSARFGSLAFPNNNNNKTEFNLWGFANDLRLGSQRKPRPMEQRAVHVPHTHTNTHNMYHALSCMAITPRVRTRLCANKSQNIHHQHVTLVTYAYLKRVFCVGSIRFFCVLRCCCLSSTNGKQCISSALWRVVQESCGLCVCVGFALSRHWPPIIATSTNTDRRTILCTK